MERDVCRATGIPHAVQRGADRSCSAFAVGEQLSGWVFASNLNYPPANLQATINWGDGNTSQGIVEFTHEGGKAGYSIEGSHTWADDDTYAISGVLTLKVGEVVAHTPETETIVVGRFLTSQAVLGAASAVPLNQGSGLTISETAGDSFSTTLGGLSFFILQTNFTPVTLINWGGRLLFTGNDWGLSDTITLSRHD